MAASWATALGLCLLTALLFAANSNANILIVPSSTFPTITAAASAASNGDTISIAPNSYTEAAPITVVDKLLYFVTQTGLRDVQLNVPGPAMPIFQLTGASVSVIGYDLNGSGGGVACVLISSSTLNLTGVDIQNCQSSSEGGAISSVGIKSRLRVINSTFTSNIAVLAGGAIFAKEGDVLVQGSTFMMNAAIPEVSLRLDFISELPLSALLKRASWLSPSFSLGGAICNLEGVLNISECTFLRNTATSGGAVANLGTASVNQSSFVENAARYAAGAFANAETAEIDGSKFIGNSAFFAGAVLSMGRNAEVPPPLSITNSIFTNNSGVPRQESGGYGGAIAYAKLVQNCSFEGNTAFIGGAIIDAMTVTNCFFQNNAASFAGGALATVGDYGSTQAKSCIFKTNHAQYGGAFYSNNDAPKPTKFLNCTFASNSASISGGAAEIAGGNNSWSSILFECNTPNSYSVILANSSFSCQSCFECCGQNCPQS